MDHVRVYKPTLILQLKQKIRRASRRQLPTSVGNAIHLQLGKIGLDSILVAYSDELSNTKANVNIGLLSIVTDSIDLNKMQFDLKSVDLNQTKFQLVHGKSVAQQDKKDTTGSQSRWMVNSPI